MQLTMHTDFALRLLIYAGLSASERVTSREVSEAYGLSHHHVTKVVQRLAHYGFVETTSGRGGGFALTRAPAAIDLGDVVERMEPHFRIVECFSPEGRCVIRRECLLKGILGEAQQAFLNALRGRTLADVLEPRDALRASLGLETA